MAEHRATIRWDSDGEFKSNRYSRLHDWTFDGGAVVKASSSPQVVAMPMSDPAAVDPEEALVASVSSCHMLWFLSIARDEGYEVASYADEAVGTMGRDRSGRISVTRITLYPEISFVGETPNPKEMQWLHHKAHEHCFIANSLRTEIVIGTR